jgi:hypothetical protein
MQEGYNCEIISWRVAVESLGVFPRRVGGASIDILNLVHGLPNTNNVNSSNRVTLNSTMYSAISSTLHVYSKYIVV